MSSPLSCSPSRRREMDVMKLMMSSLQVETDEESIAAFTVKLPGPKDSPYDGGMWTVRVELPMEYPYKSPSIGFVDRMFHPNVDELSGSVCLDVINQTWTPMYDLLHVFQVFLPQLLMYPNPSDPLNGEAAALLLKDPDRYNARVKETIDANPQALAQPEPQNTSSAVKQVESDVVDEDLSELSEMSAMSDNDDGQQFNLEQ
eukprot:TRINITY_DN19450_c0_g1_i1.p1 TRINITY_DN19450_c0_g1~~TRINITY_DN19450_c0_g1_i1.p1  ORF type:complete len:202 (+),score=49.72 TRINITY_DN19450_c0_g1_i1:38-643(+)